MTDLSDWEIADVRRNGQAMIEVIVALAAIVALLAALLQVASLNLAQTDTMTNARREVGLRALGEEATSANPDYIRYWQEGPDESRYSVDDVHTPAAPSLFENTIVNKAAATPADWQIMQEVPANRVAILHQAGDPSDRFGFVNGQDNKSVNVLPAVRSLLYNSESINVKSEVWLPHTRGIY